MEQDRLRRYGVYQIYPISFCDSDGDGKGDLKGILSKLDYLSSLGIHNLWLSPIYVSPMRDMGYDIADYYAINPIFGTMEDFATLVKEAEKRDIKIIMDLVVNHTSSDHPWFQEALKAPDSKYRDYYIFRKGENGKRPNNWTSSFGGSAWEEVEGEKGTYYLHLYGKEQPDLNWHNEEVYQEVKKILNFWMDKGVYGFRCDVISEIYKTSFEDGKKRKISEPVGAEHFIAQKGCHQILKRLRKEAIQPRHGVLIGELYGVDDKQAQEFLDGELDTLFGFEITDTKSLLRQRIRPKDFKNVLVKWQENVSCNGNYLENHDQHRSVGKYVKRGRDEIAGAKMLLTLLCALKGVPFFYQGQELALVDYNHLSEEESHDIVRKFLEELLKKYAVPPFLRHFIARKFGRDDARGPMPFSSIDGFGFTLPGRKPWQKFYDVSKERNVERGEKDPSSVLSYFRKALSLRQSDDVLSFGEISFLPSDREVLLFLRTYQGKRRVALFNLSDKRKEVPSFPEGKKDLLLSNVYPRKKEDSLLPYESRIYRIDEPFSKDG